MTEGRFSVTWLTVALAVIGLPAMTQQYPVVDNVTGDPTTILPQ